jgi:hypothetical protein
MLFYLCCFFATVLFRAITKDKYNQQLVVVTIMDQSVDFPKDVDLNANPGVSCYECEKPIERYLNLVHAKTKPFHISCWFTFQKRCTEIGDKWSYSKTCGFCHNIIKTNMVVNYDSEPSLYRIAHAHCFRKASEKIIKFNNI